MNKQSKPLQTQHAPGGVKLVRGKQVFTIAPDEFATVQGSIDKYLFRESVYKQHGFPYDDKRTKGANHE